MKKIKKLLIIITGALLAVLMWLLGKIFFTGINSRGVAMYGVQTPITRGEAHMLFNNKIRMYQGTNIQGTIIRELYSEINLLNAANESLIVEYIGPSISEIRPSRKYNVECKYNEKGYVCKVIVKENEEINNNNNEMNNI